MAEDTPTNLSDTVTLTSEKATYDQSVKELFADPQIMARILKGTLAELQSYSIDAIMQMLCRIQVSKVDVRPGFSNMGNVRQRRKIELEQQEDGIPGEGQIYYDIRCSLVLPDGSCKILINVEAQKSTDSRKLRYHLDNRIIYYLARMISAQRGVEFFRSMYDDLKPVRSIWICMDAADTDDSINRIGLSSETIYGSAMDFTNLDKVQGIVVRLRKNENVEKSGNKLIAMLEELLRKEPAEKKIQILENEYDMIMSEETGRRVNTMCNLSDVMIERGIERGIELGKTQGIKLGNNLGIAQEQESVIRKLLTNGFSPDRISELLGYSKEKISLIANTIS